MMGHEQHDFYKVNSLTGLDKASACRGHDCLGCAALAVEWRDAAGRPDPRSATFFSWSALAVFLVTAGVTLCAGHSVGFHRRLIHRSFECPKWLERVLIWLGTAVGMGGPIWTIRLHDSRDWAQRQPDCHWFLRHGKPLLVDGFYYLNFRLRLEHPPGFDPGPGIGDDRFYLFLQRTWMLQQIPVAALSIGSAAGPGWSGACSSASPPARPCTGTSPTSRTRSGPQDWIVDDAVIQAYNVAAHGDPDHGRELAQQPSRLPRLRAPRPLSRADRSRLPVRAAAGEARPGLEREGSRQPAAAPGISPVRARSLSVCAPGQAEISRVQS